MILSAYVADFILNDYNVCWFCGKKLSKYKSKVNKTYACDKKEGCGFTIHYYFSISHCYFDLVYQDQYFYVTEDRNKYVLARNKYVLAEWNEKARNYHDIDTLSPHLKVEELLNILDKHLKLKVFA